MVKGKKTASKSKQKKQQRFLSRRPTPYIIGLAILGFVIIVGIFYASSFNTQKADKISAVTEKVKDALTSRESTIDESNNKRLNALSSLVQVDPTSLRSIKYYKCAFDSNGQSGWVITGWDQYCNIRNISVIQTSESFKDVARKLNNDQTAPALGKLRGDINDVSCGAMTGSINPSVRVIFATNQTNDNDGRDCNFLYQDEITTQEDSNPKVKVLNSFKFSSLDKTKDYIILDYTEEFFRESIGCNIEPFGGCKPAFDVPAANF